MTRLREHIFALSIHIGIIICVGILVMATSCGDPEPPPPEPDPVGDFFDQVQDGLDEAGAETVIVIAVIDNADAGDNMVRQIYQEIQTQLDNLGSVSIIEQPKAELEALFEETGVDPNEGISPQNAMDLAAKLSVNALLYASIESTAPDVHVKIYAAETGAVVFAETLQEWPLPVTDVTDPMEDLLEPEPPPSE